MDLRQRGYGFVCFVEVHRDRTGGVAFGIAVDGDRLTAKFSKPAELAFDRHGTLFVADSFNHVVRKISPAGRVETVTGLVSGLLGVGGGIVFVPLVTTMLGMPLKRALGTSLVLIAIIAIPGTIVHALLGHIHWGIAFVLMLGVIPGARIGASIALGTRERTLRLMVGSFLLVVAVAYGVTEIARLARG